MIINKYGWNKWIAVLQLLHKSCPFCTNCFHNFYRIHKNQHIYLYNSVFYYCVTTCRSLIASKCRIRPAWQIMGSQLESAFPASLLFFVASIILPVNSHSRQKDENLLSEGYIRRLRVPCVGFSEKILSEEFYLFVREYTIFKVYWEEKSLKEVNVEYEIIPILIISVF